MMLLALLGMSILATTASAEQFEFRGEFVKTYTTEAGFVQTLPPGTKMACKRDMGCAANKQVCKERIVNHCSTNGVARIYVFKNGAGTNTFWSAEINNLLYDDPTQITEISGIKGHVIAYDETNQLIYRTSTTVEDDIKMSKKLEHSIAPTYKQLIEMGDRNEEIHQKELERRFKLETGKYIGK
jgi:hypothetical protein